MKQKLNLILTLISFTVTSLLLVLVMFAWYATNKVATVTGGTALTAEDGFSLSLEKGTYDSNNKTWSWEETNSLLFSNVSTGNAFYFRIKVTLKENKSMQVSFDDVTSTLIDGKLVVNSVTKSGATVKYVANKNGNYLINLYQIIDNQVLTEDETDNVLYTINGTTISLGNYEIGDVFYYYNYGAGTATYFDNNVTNQDVSLDTHKYISNCGSITTFTADADVTTSADYIYFALEFNENASLCTIDGVESSNAYLYQKLTIGAISVKEG